MRKFYCQFCGSEVPLNAKKCPDCLKEFGSVLCPKCNYSGDARRFTNGCPECGYLKQETVNIPDKEKRSFNLSFRLFTALGVALAIAIIILINILIS